VPGSCTTPAVTALARRAFAGALSWPGGASVPCLRGTPLAGAGVQRTPASGGGAGSSLRHWRGPLPPSSAGRHQHPAGTTRAAALRLAVVVAPTVLLALAPLCLTVRRKATLWVSHPAEAMPCQATLTRAHVKRRRWMAGRSPQGRAVMSGTVRYDKIQYDKIWYDTLHSHRTLKIRCKDMVWLGDARRGRRAARRGARPRGRAPRARHAGTTKPAGRMGGSHLLGAALHPVNKPLFKSRLAVGLN
jgi:hypothetical protein